MSTVSRPTWNKAFPVPGLGGVYLESALMACHPWARPRPFTVCPSGAIPTFELLEGLVAILWATRLSFASAPLTTYNASFGLWVRGLAVGPKTR